MYLSVFNLSLISVSPPPPGWNMHSFLVVGTTATLIATDLHLQCANPPAAKQECNRPRQGGMSLLIEGSCKLSSYWLWWCATSISIGSNTYSKLANLWSLLHHYQTISLLVICRLKLLQKCWCLVFLFINIWKLLLVITFEVPSFGSSFDTKTYGYLLSSTELNNK